MVSRCPPESTIQMHCGWLISFALAIAAARSFCAPSNVSFADGAVSAILLPLWFRNLLHVRTHDLLIAFEDRFQLVLADDVVKPVEALAAGALLDRVDDHVRRRGAVLHHDLAGRRQ